MKVNVCACIVHVHCYYFMDVRAIIILIMIPIFHNQYICMEQSHSSLFLTISLN